MAPRRPSNSDWNPFGDLLRPFQDQAPAREARASRPRKTRNADPAAQPRVTKVKAQPADRTEPRRVDARHDRFPILNGMRNIVRSLEPRVRYDGRITQGPGLVPGPHGARVTGDAVASVRNRTVSTTASFNYDPAERRNRGVTFQTDVPVLGRINATVHDITIQNNVPTRASWSYGLLSGVRELTAADRARGNTGPVAASVDVNLLLGGGITYRPREGAPPPRANIVAKPDGSIEYTVDMAVASAQLGDGPRGQILTGAGDISLRGRVDPNGKITVAVDRMDVANARVRVPAGGRRTDSIDASRLTLGARTASDTPRQGLQAGERPTNSIVFQNGTMVGADIRGAEVRGLRASLTQSNPSDANGRGPEARLLVNDPDNAGSGADARRISFQLRNVDQVPAAQRRSQDQVTELRFSTDVNGLNVRLAGDRRGVPFDLRDGLVATLYDGTDISGTGTLSWTGGVRRDRSLTTSTMGVHATGENPATGRRELVMRTRADLHGGDQLIGNLAAANFRLGATGTLRISDYDTSTDNYRYALDFDAGNVIADNKPSSIRVQQLPSTRDVQVSQLANGTVDGARLAVNLAVDRSKERLDIRGNITGSIAGGDVHIPYNSNGTLDLRVNPSDAQSQARIAVNVPVNISVGDRGIVSTLPEPPAGTADLAQWQRGRLPPVGISTEAWAACQRTLDSGSTTLPALVTGANAAVCASGIDLQAVHQTHDTSLLRNTTANFDQQAEILRRASQDFRDDEVSALADDERRASREAELTRLLTDKGRRLGVDVSAAPNAVTDDPSNIRVDDLVRTARNVRFQMDIPLTAGEAPEGGQGVPGQERVIPVRNDWLAAADLRIPADTYVRVETPSDRPDSIRVRFYGKDERGNEVDRPVTLSSSVWGLGGETSFAQLELRRDRNGALEVDPQNMRDTTWLPMRSLIASTVGGMFAPPADRTSATRPRGEFVSETLGNLVRNANVRIDDENPATRIAATLGPEMSGFVGTALRRATITNTGFEVPADSSVVFGNNFVSFTQPTRLSITKAAGERGLTVTGNDVSLGPTHVTSPGRLLDLGSARADTFSLRTTIDPDLSVNQRFEIGGLSTTQMRMRMTQPGARVPTTYELAPESVAGNFAMTMTTRPDPAPGQPRRPIETTVDARLTIDGPITVEGLNIAPTSEDSGRASIERLRLQARDAQVVIANDQLSIDSPGSRARVQYSGELVSPQPARVRFALAAGSYAIGDLQHMSTYIGSDPSIERSELRMRNLASRTDASGGPRDPAVTGDITLKAGTPALPFTAQSAWFVVPELAIRNFSDDPARNMRHIEVTAMRVSDMDLQASYDGSRDGEPVVANFRARADLEYALALHADQTDSQAFGAMRFRKAQILANGGGVFSAPISHTAVEEQLATMRRFIETLNATPPVPPARRIPTPTPAPRGEIPKPTPNPRRRRS